MDKKVVITGMAIINPLGFDKEEVLEGVKSCRSAARLLELFPTESFPFRVAAQIDCARLNSIGCGISGYENFRVDRKTLIGILTIVEAFKDLQYDFNDPLEAYNLGISLGIGINNLSFERLLNYFKLRKEDKLQLIYQDIINNGNITQLPYDYVSRWVRKNYGFSGPVHNNLSACSASTQAIGVAYRWIKQGNAKIVLTGGIDSILNPIGISGFSILGTLTGRNDDPKGASRPFDKSRDGFVPGEGAGILFLEELEHALDRGAKIYGEVCGYGSSMDAYKITAPCPDGLGATIAIKNAVSEAGWDLDEVEYVNAHGTSTYLNDISETQAIKSVFGQHAYSIPISSCKSQIGHLIAASGAVEIIMCLLGLNRGILPATINLKEPDPECDLDYVPNQVRQVKITKFIKNSFALGGQNATLAIKVQQTV